MAIFKGTVAHTFNTQKRTMHKENSIHKKNVEYTFQIIDSPKRISIRDKVSQNTEKNIFQYATKSFQMRHDV